MTLNAQNLADAMRNSAGVDYAGLFPAVNQCLLDCDCTTVDRSAMWFGQVGEESGGLRWMEEIADGSEYEWRQDLGNTQQGDGPRFKGRGPIQVTGRHNYTALSQWAYDQGLVPTPTFFVDDPEQLASNQYGFIGVTWYWTTQRPMNDAADARDIVRATQYVNGGTNGLADRTQRWNNALSMGDAILPSGNAPTPVAPPVFNEDNRIGETKNFSSRNGDTVDLLIIHTEEPKEAPYSRDAESLLTFIKNSENSENQVSYHYAASQAADGSVSVIDLVDTDQECWAVLDSNPDSINYCFANSSVNLITDEWMEQFGNAIDVVAYLVVQDARKYGVALNFLFPDPNDNSQYPGPPPGITDHKYVTDFLGDGSHLDVGPNFPWVYFGERINYYAGTGEDDMPLINGPSRSMYRQSNDPIGPGTEVEYQNNEMLHEKTVEDDARDGIPYELSLVLAVAQGVSPVQADIPAGKVERAKFIADKLVPKTAKAAAQKLLAARQP